MRSLGHSDMTNSESAENTKDPPPAIMDAGIQNREQKKKKKWIDFDERSVNVIIHAIHSICAIITHRTTNPYYQNHY